jgi:LuxR family maltose regulon positive regulatory protein
VGNTQLASEIESDGSDSWPDSEPRSTPTALRDSRYAPPPPRPSVPRPELFDRLDAGAERPLTLVTGAPGAGKTMLLSGWLAARAQPGAVAWLSLEPMHARPAQFWADLLGVVEEVSSATTDSVVGRSTLLEPVDAFAEAAARLPGPLLLVLDDFEQLHSRSVVEELDRFLRKRSDRIRLVIASRLDPGLSLQRQRLEGRLAELRSTDLAFSRAQARELFRMAGLDLSPEQVDKLHERTEGWAGGLALAALSLNEHPDPDRFVRTFAGDERTVADYLVEEVLQQQPAEVCEFMLRTSVVDELEPGLADALTGTDHGAQMLERLERANAFLVPLDRRRRHYRYHPMFMELLRSQLKYRMPDAFALEHRRAARWFAANGRAAVAVRHAFSAGDVAAATDLLSQHWLSLVVGGEAEELVSHIDELPQQAVAGSAELSLAGAGALLDVGDLQRAEKYIVLSDARGSSVAPKRRASYNLARAVVRMLDARLRGDFETARTAAVKVLAGHQFAVIPSECRALALLNLGIAECWSYSSRDGREHLEEALELARREQCEYVALGCLSQLALAEALEGALRDAVGFAQAAIRTAARHGWDERALAAPAHLALAIVNFYRAEADAASEQLELAARAAHRSEERTTRCLIDLVRALLLARADVGEAARIARAARSYADDWDLPQTLAAKADVVEAALLAFAGELERAQETLARAPAAQAPAEVSLIRARIALAEREPAEAMRRLQPYLTPTREPLHPASRVEAHALAALAKHLLHDDQGALALVEQALAEAQPQGYRQPLLAVGAPLRELLKRRVRAGTAQRALAGDLIQALEQRQGISDENYGHLLLDPLSDREEAVLRYLPTLMSKAEIASELFVSVNTVKTHTKNIYRKLGVGTRTAAVRRAKSLNLV